jgi:hypothetical protein
MCSSKLTIKFELKFAFSPLREKEGRGREHHYFTGDDEKIWKGFAVSRAEKRKNQTQRI